MKTDLGDRRKFLKTVGMATAYAAASGIPGTTEQTPVRNTIPRWRGFNLQYFYKLERGIKTPQEDHFRWIAGWGFDFVRLPMAYRTWLKKKISSRQNVEVDDVYQIDENTLGLIDEAVEFGQKHRVHVSLNFHHGPGYCIHGGTREPFDLWKDQAALDAFCWHWEMFAKRYRGIPRSAISYNLINEPPWPGEKITPDDYKRVVAAAAQTIRSIDPDNLVIADGLGAGNLAVPEIVPLGVAQSVHGYAPGIVSHWKVSWSARTDWPEAKWPDAVDEKGEIWNRKRLERHYAPWNDLVGQGVGVHMGECSGSSALPHGIFLAWFSDVLDIMKSMGAGYALWDFIGESRFGILDTGRKDVVYEDWYGHKLDRKMLAMLQKY